MSWADCLRGRTILASPPQKKKKKLWKYDTEVIRCKCSYRWMILLRIDIMRALSIYIYNYNVNGHDDSV